MRAVTLGRAALWTAVRHPAWWLAGIAAALAPEWLRLAGGTHGSALLPRTEWGPLASAGATWAAIGWLTALQRSEWVADRLRGVERFIARCSTTAAVAGVAALAALSLGGQVDLQHGLAAALLALELGVLVGVSFEWTCSEAGRGLFVASAAWVAPALVRGLPTAPWRTILATPILSQGPGFSEIPALRWADAVSVGALLVAALWLRRAPSR